MDIPQGGDAHRRPATHNPGRSLYLEHEWKALRAEFALSKRELEVVQGVFDDLSEGEIGRRMELSVHTVHTYLKRVFRKLKATSRVEVVCIVAAAEKRLRRVEENRAPRPGVSPD